ncbi:MAG: rhodanese-like domain-containing protein [Campylobacterota bacterium]|nr:rhodanese-like domain-containing protein [Campylobacterota bacterium]
MKKLFLLLTLATLSLFAEVKQEFASQKLIDSKIKIIDIRTPGEWRETGLLKGAIPIMFFDERGQYDIKAFMNELSRHIKPKEEFALICRSGSRTMTVASFLDKELGYKVINIRGGMLYAMGQKLPIEAYKPKK